MKPCRSYRQGSSNIKQNRKTISKRNEGVPMKRAYSSCKYCKFKGRDVSQEPCNTCIPSEFIDRETGLKVWDKNGDGKNDYCVSIVRFYKPAMNSTRRSKKDTKGTGLIPLVRHENQKLRKKKHLRLKRNGKNQRNSRGLRLFFYFSRRKSWWFYHFRGSREPRF